MSDRVIRESDSLRGFERLFGREEWKAVLGGWLERKGEADPFLPVSDTFLFCGQAGSGKRTICLALAGEARKRGWKVCSVYAEELVGEDGSLSEEALGELKACLSEEPVLVILHRLDLLPCIGLVGRRTLPQLSAMFEETRERGGRCLIAATAEDFKKVPARLRECFRIASLKAPGKEERAAFLQAGLSDVYSLPEGQDWGDLAGMLEGESYGVIADFIRDLRLSAGAASGFLPAGEAGKPVLILEWVKKIQNCLWREPESTATESVLRRFISEASSRGITGSDLAGKQETILHVENGSSGKISARSTPSKTKTTGKEEPSDPLDGLEKIDDDALAEAQSVAEEVKEAIGKKPEDYTSEELAEMGYVEKPEIPEDPEKLKDLSPEERENCFEDFGELFGF